VTSVSVATELPDEPARPRAWHRSDLGELAGSLLSAFAVTWLAFRLLSWNGALGFGIVWYLLFLLLYREVVRQVHGSLLATDRTVTVLVVTGFAVAFVALAFVVVFVTIKGARTLRVAFFTKDIQGVGPLDPATAGGGKHAIIGTLEQTGLATLLSVPLAVATAVYLHEVGGRVSRAVKIVVDAMSGLPSIVAGLFIYTLLIVQLQAGYSGLAGALAISVLMLPTVTRTAEEVLRIVPGGLREASLALGAPQWRMVWRVVLPTARSGMVTASILGVARAVGETAPLVLTAFGNTATIVNPFKQAQADLPLFVYFQLLSFKASEIQRAWTGAFVLMLLVLLLFTAARYVSGRRAKAR
jgi:phosphate transport system permease protein